MKTHQANLLPGDYQAKYRTYLASLYIRRFMLIQIGLLLVVTGVLFGAEAYYRLQQKNVNQDIARLESIQGQFDIESIRQAAALQNDKLKVAAQILDNRPRLSLILDDIAKLIPNGVTIDSISLNGFPSSVLIKGRAAQRDQVVLFQNRLETSDLVKVSFAPLSNLTRATDTPFEFTLEFNNKDILLQAK